MPWKLTVDNMSLTADDMTLAECERVEKATGTDWSHLNPLESAGHAKAIITTLIARTDPAGADARAGAMTLKQLLSAYQLVDDDLPSELIDGVPPVGDGGVTAG